MIKVIKAEEERNAQIQAIKAGANSGGCLDSTEIVIYYYLEISKSLSQCASMQLTYSNLLY